MTLQLHLVLGGGFHLRPALQLRRGSLRPAVPQDGNEHFLVRPDDPRLNVRKQAVDDFINTHGVLPVRYL